MQAEAAAPVLTLAVDRGENAAIVRCKGKLVAGVNEVFYTEVIRLAADTRRIVLDLTELTQMDSMGLGALIRLYVSTKSTGTELQLVNLGPRIRQLLGMTRVLSAFTVIGEHNVIIP
jgi:anti-anti-sigma factor